ncbi:MAG: radical SAM family heme chaperone HemW [Pirellulales bacterium]|nr:radical SAM family heme chaperone HemW [Pirellulales bacterium]
MTSSLPPRAAYIHIPFCKHRCGYCNFALVAGRDDLVAPYLDALGRELSFLARPRSVDTLYFGGGTPTFLSCDQLAQICELVLHWHPLRRAYEWTVEANPGDLDGARLQTLARNGVTRLSLGAQSFCTAKLARLERDHQAADIRHAVRLARDAGLRLSIDLIFAAPEETLPQWQADLEAAIALDPEHISTYGLTFEKGTPFWTRRQRRELVPVSEEIERTMYLEAIDKLIQAGYEHYEISNFGKPGHRSRHNEVYWSGQSYFAAGPGAARYVDGVRSTNHRSTLNYMQRLKTGESPVAERELLGPEQRAREMLILGLRRIEGVNRQEFFSRSGFDVEALCGNEIARFVDLGLLQDDGPTLRLTRDGLLVSDSLWPELV